MVGYAAVETALARMHGADEEAQKGAFRGRIKHLQRLGLPLGEKPGKGKRIDYSAEQIWQFALALELSEFGLDPTVIVEIITNHWSFLLHPWLEGQSASSDPGEPILVISLALMQANWRPVGDSMKGIHSIGWIPRSDLGKGMFSKEWRSSVAVDTWKMLRELDRMLNLGGEE